MALVLQIAANSGVYTDTGGTTEATNGQTIGSSKVLSGVLANSLFTQSTGANRPTLRTTSTAEMEFTGTSVSLGLATSSTLQNLTQYTVQFVMRFDSGVTSSQFRHIWGASANSGWLGPGCFFNKTLYGSSYTANFYPAGYLNGSMEFTTPDENTSTRFVLMMACDGSKICMWINTQGGAPKTRATTISFGSSAYCIGDHATTPAGYGAGPNFFLSEHSLWNTALTPSEAQTEQAAAMTRWGVTNTATTIFPSGGGVVIPGNILSNVMVS